MPTPPISQIGFDEHTLTWATSFTWMLGPLITLNLIVPSPETMMQITTEHVLSKFPTIKDFVYPLANRARYCIDRRGGVEILEGHV